ncbi:ABC transporter substrate-binding protein [Desulfobacterales bacterium HSG2]|nr:ABC transporter substrate-binding protein [Desulfobacterales bacterium HSG2]
MKKVCVKVMVCLIIVAICGGRGLAKEPLQPMTIRLNWVTNVQFAGVLLAKERGWYEEQGIDLTIKGWEQGISSIDEVLAGKAQVGVIEGADIIRFRAKGKKIRAIATQFQKSPFCLMSKKNRGINTPDQLAGKKIGITAPSGELMVKIVLASRGLNFNDITPVQMGWDIGLFIDDSVDTMQAYMNNEPFLLKEKGYDVNYLPAFKYGYDFYSGIFFATDKMLMEHPDLIQKFLDVSRRGWQESFKELPGTVQLIVEKYYPEGSVRQQTESLKVFKYVAAMGIGKSLIGFMEERTWRKGIDTLHKFGQIEKKIPATDVFTLEFLKK